MVGAAAEAPGLGVLLVGGVVVTAEDEVLDAQPVGLLLQPAQIGREIFGLEADVEMEPVGVLLPQASQRQDIVVQLGGQHPDMADEAGRGVGPRGVVGKAQHRVSAAERGLYVRFLGAGGMAAPGGVGVIIGEMRLGHGCDLLHAELF